MPLRYLRTVQHLRPEQIYFRLWRRIYKPKVNDAPAPPLRETQGNWSPCAGRSQRIFGTSTFRFLNETRDVTSAADWNSPHCSKLWLYNLHYFDDLVAENSDLRTKWHELLVQRWIRENSPTIGNGWEPYPTSLRTVNWIKWALTGRLLNADILHSLAIQVRHLFRRIEFHLLGNHLLANAKALVFAGAFFAGDESEQWLVTGLELLKRELAEQFLSDGGHFERSPMYHSILTEDLLDLVQLQKIYAPAFKSRRQNLLQELNPLPMLSWLRTMTHPDGDISFFNDAARGIAPRVDDLDNYAGILGCTQARRPDAKLTHLQQSGYVRLHCGTATLLLDVGELGPDYLPSHGHADTLSFELSLSGERVLLNSGTSAYTGQLRKLQRRTAAHNTVTVDEMDSSELWGDFRVGQRAKPFDVDVAEDCVSGSHDGYHRLSGRPTHRRSWSLQSGELRIQDTIEGVGHHRIALYLHSAPGLHFVYEEGSWLLQEGGRLIATITCPSGTQMEQVKTQHFPKFGMAAPNSTLITRWSGRLPFSGRTLISWPKA
jgi:uncharacterized heparinase superfamily protein